MFGYDEKFKKSAVALKYENNQIAPIVVASGNGYLAEKIIEVAHDNDVPVYEDTSLATMLSQLEIGREIPQELYKAIVEIYVYFLNYSPNKKEEEIELEEK
ncbi:MAG: EscU/YscU/HrcU family type III secretion system export apparatus switch protein [Anaerotignaceae bacterium]